MSDVVVNEKIASKIRKLLALGGSPNENERAREAQGLYRLTTK